MRPTIRFSACALTTALAATLVPASHSVSAADRAPVVATPIKPGALPRGADVAIPHVDGRHVVDGDVRVRVGADYLRLLGRSGKAYVVHVANADGTTNSRIQRVTAQGERTKLLRGVDGQAVRLSTDGRRLAAAHVRGADQTVLKVWSATTGALQTKRSFDGVLSVLDLAGRRVVLGGSGPARTIVWDVVANTFEVVSGRQGYAASLAGDRLATYTKDPYAGGCSKVTRLSKPSVLLWSSCRQRVDRFSPSGRRVATVALLADGVGPDVVRVLASRGRTLAKYTVNGWFGQVRWESDTRLLLDANGRRQLAVVRCDKALCERASDLSPAQTPRPS
jgi:hypothetical protein